MRDRHALLPGGAAADAASGRPARQGHGGAAAVYGRRDARRAAAASGAARGKGIRIPRLRPSGRGCPAAARDRRRARGGPAALAPGTAALLAHTTIGESEAYLPERFREKYLKNPGRPVTVGKLWITEGRKHQVKLMIKAVGGHVFYLKRLAIGPVRLDEALRPGEYRPLTAEELAALMPPATSGGGTAEA